MFEASNQESNALERNNFVPLESISKNWNTSEWEIYLSAMETPNDDEVIYVGTSHDLENYVAKQYRKK